MKNKITANQMCVTFSCDNIDRDYDFYKISTSEKWISDGAEFLDISGTNYIKAVSYDASTSFYIMTDSDAITRQSLIQLLNNCEKGDTLSLEKVKSKMVPEHTLIQLFVNSLATPKNAAYSFNNLSGRFLYYSPENARWKDEDLISIDVLELKVKKNMCMVISAHKMTPLRFKDKMVFGKRKLYAYPQYEFSMFHHTLKRVAAKDRDKDENLIMKPLYNQKGTVEFLNYENYAKFSSTKTGMLYDVLQLVKENFSQYFSIRFMEYDAQDILSPNKRKLDQYKDKVFECVRKNGVHFTDIVNTEESKGVLAELGGRLKVMVPGTDISFGSRLSGKKLNIRLIHEKAYYEKGEADPYNPKSGNVVQHVTMETLDFWAKIQKVTNGNTDEEKKERQISAIRKSEDLILFVLLKELTLKKEVGEQAFTLDDWAGKKYNGDWIFGIKIKDKFLFMRIHPGGTFVIEETVPAFLAKGQYDRLMRQYSERQDSDILGIIADAGGNINLIKNTEIRTMACVESIGNILKEEAKTEKFHGDEVLRFLDSAKSMCRPEIQKLLDLKKCEVNSAAIYTKKDILALFSGDDKGNRVAKKAVVDFVFNNTGSVLYTYLRSKEFRDDFFTGMVDINYMPVNENKALYCVGKNGSGMNYDFARTNVVREIEAVDESRLIFDELLPLMEVGFVRYGEVTVIPFPFKHLRLYAETLSVDEG